MGGVIRILFSLCWFYIIIIVIDHEANIIKGAPLPSIAPKPIWWVVFHFWSLVGQMAGVWIADVPDRIKTVGRGLSVCCRVVGGWVAHLSSRLKMVGQRLSVRYRVVGGWVAHLSSRVKTVGQRPFLCYRVVGGWVADASTGVRVFLTLMFLLVFGAMGGCGTEWPGESRTTLKFASWGATQDQVVYHELIRRFESANADTHVSLMFIPFGNYFTKIQLLIIGRVAPDIVTLSGSMAYQLNRNGHLVDLTPFIEAERVHDPGFFSEERYSIDALRPICTFDNGIYYVPVGPMVFHLYYNKDLFDKAGVPYPREGWTWDDFVRAARALTLEENGRIVQWGFNCYNWPDLWRLFIMQNGGDIFDDYTHPTRCLLDSPEAIEAMQFVQDLIYKYRVSPTPLQATQNVSTDFMTGRLAMSIHGTWMVEQYRNIKQFRWDMGPLPMKKRYANLVSVGGYGMTSQCRDREKAWRFLKNFLTEDTQRLMSTDVALWQPTLKSLIDEGYMDNIPGVPEHHSMRFTEIARATPMVALQHPQAPRILDTLASEVDPIFLGKESPAECLKRVASKINELLGKETP